ncbi:hypothetical protein ACO1PK_09140 [Alishewanella sp. d11]|uniref:hypothetical protein n=1 Tax=Alishewanella sp. d11 TaxID=3414030 RepID=UPI003BF7A0C8
MYSPQSAEDQPMWIWQQPDWPGRQQNAPQVFRYDHVATAINAGAITTVSLLAVSD